MPVFAGIMHQDHQDKERDAPNFPDKLEIEEVERTKMASDWMTNLPLGASAGHSWDSISEAWMWESARPPRRPGLDAVAPPDVEPAPKGGKGYPPMDSKGYPPMPEGGKAGRGPAGPFPGGRALRDPLDPFDRTWDVKEWQRSAAGPPPRKGGMAPPGVYGEVVEPTGKGNDRWTHDIFLTRSSVASTASRGSHVGSTEKRMKVPPVEFPYGNSRESNHTSMRDEIQFSPYTNSGASDVTTVLGPPGSASPEQPRKEEPTFVPATEERVSSHALEEMQYITDRGGESTVWMRVVHSGYGQDTWRTSLRTCGLTCVFAQSPSEGAYVHLPAGWNRQQLINTMNDINLDVRRRVRFRDMNRSNKSRLQFKQDLLTISYPPWPNGRPGPTTRVIDKAPAGSHLPPRPADRARSAADEWSLFMQQMEPAAE